VGRNDIVLVKVMKMKVMRDILPIGKKLVGRDTMMMMMMKTGKAINLDDIC